MDAVESSRVSNSLFKRIVKTKRYLKVLPMLMAGLYLTNTVLSSFGIDYSFFSYTAGVGILPWLLVLKASYSFGFCEYHRMFLWYILANNIVCWSDVEFGLPISDWNLLVLHFIMAGIFLFLVLFFWKKCRKNLK